MIRLFFFEIGVVDIKQEDVKRMINREDMLELTRRMTPARASVAGSQGPILMKKAMWMAHLIRIF